MSRDLGSSVLVGYCVWISLLELQEVVKILVTPDPCICLLENCTLSLSQAIVLLLLFFLLFFGRCRSILRFLSRFLRFLSRFSRSFCRLSFLSCRLGFFCGAISGSSVFSFVTGFSLGLFAFLFLFLSLLFGRCLALGLRISRLDRSKFGFREHAWGKLAHLLHLDARDLRPLLEGASGLCEAQRLP